MTAAVSLPPTERKFLLGLQEQALRYFLDNQTADGLILDRQSNHGPLREGGLCSTAATGMGLIALALASAEPYRLFPRSTAVDRVRRALEGARDRLPHTRGVMPHFVDATTGAVLGTDQRSTIDGGWLVAGGLWAALFLDDRELQHLAAGLYERIDWQYWTVPPGTAGAGLLQHGQDSVGRFLPSCWDRLNGETIFLYVLAAGADESRAWSAEGWGALRTFPGRLADLHFGSADLGLFVFQYGMDLLDLRQWREPGGVDLVADAVRATEANYRFCRGLGDQFVTFRHHWGLSAGDGPGDKPSRDDYRCYSPGGPIDGTAHLTASLASIAHAPAQIWENLWHAERNQTLPARGRYGFSNLNHDCHWRSRDMVGIDVGAAILALDNYLADQRVRRTFHQLSCVQQGLNRLRFRPQPAAEAEQVTRRAS